jgi:hypothetical protein
LNLTGIVNEFHRSCRPNGRRKRILHCVDDHFRPNWIFPTKSIDIGLTFENGHILFLLFRKDASEALFL